MKIFHRQIWMGLKGYSRQEGHTRGSKAWRFEIAWHIEAFQMSLCASFMVYKEGLGER